MPKKDTSTTTAEPTNIEEAREARAKKLTTDEQELADIIAEATPEGEAPPEVTEGELPEVGYNQGMSVDEIVTAHGALQLRFGKLEVEVQKMADMAAYFRAELEKARNVIKTQRATIANLARKVRGR